jgi:hypothetical protein
METISDAYLNMQKELHVNPNYEVMGAFYSGLVKQIYEQIKGSSISDYGAGKCSLKKGLNDLGLNFFQYFPFDPAFPEYGPAKSADLVCCIDVLEHIEPEFVDNVILDLSQITKKFGFFTIATGPATKKLADGRNAHLIQKPTSWWLKKITDYFDVQHLQRQDDHGFWLVVTPIKAN